MRSEQHLSMSDPGGCRLRGRVVATEALGLWRRLTLEVPGWRGSRPGQFALLQADSSPCFLARAISVSDESGDKVSFIIAPVGDGTEELCGLAEGEAVWVSGRSETGSTWTRSLSPGRAVVVAGGVGVAPFPLLLSRMKRDSPAPAPRSCWSCWASAMRRRQKGPGRCRRRLCV